MNEGAHKGTYISVCPWEGKERCYSPRPSGHPSTRQAPCWHCHTVLWQFCHPGSLRSPPNSPPPLSLTSSTESMGQCSAAGCCSEPASNSSKQRRRWNSSPIADLGQVHLWRTAAAPTTAHLRLHRSALHLPAHPSVGSPWFSCLRILTPDLLRGPQSTAALGATANGWWLWTEVQHHLSSWVSSILQVPQMPAEGTWAAKRPPRKAERSWGQESTVPSWPLPVISSPFPEQSTFSCIFPITVEQFHSSEQSNVSLPELASTHEASSHSGPISLLSGPTSLECFSTAC